MIAPIAAMSRAVNTVDAEACAHAGAAEKIGRIGRQIEI
jgi:hypothetical protein